MRTVADITNQLRGRAGDAQVPGARVGLAQMLGGVVNGMDVAAASVHVFTR